MMKRAIRPLALLLPLALIGCGGGSYDDLDAWMEEVKSRERVPIEPIPTFEPYEPFTYNVAAMRAPFDVPVKVEQTLKPSAASTVGPDPDRSKEFLESFSLESLQFVGILSRGDEFYALIDDGAGKVHRVQEGNYLGRNHGRIVEATEGYLSIVEIVPDGTGGWVERPRTLKLAE